MEQNIQPNENSAEIKLDGEGEPIVPKAEKKINKKIILLIIIILVVVGAGAVYFLFLNKGDNSKLSTEENVKVIKDEEVAEVEIDRKLDTDQDGLPDYLEKILETDENNLDTDGDSYSDFEEVKNGYNPLNEEKYTDEEWGAVKEEIRGEDEEFYESIFIEKDEIEIQSVFKSYIESFTALDYEVFLNNITSKSKIELENMVGYEFEIKQFEKASYIIIEKDKKYVVMAPEFREQEYEDGAKIKMPNIYLEYEENSWRVDHMLVQIDTMTRDHFSPEEAERGMAAFIYERRTGKSLKDIL